MTIHVQHPFPPVMNEACQMLILGSFPSVKSREEGFFYGHPRNRFWQVLSAVFCEETPRTIPEKKTFLLRHHIALWDVIASCDIAGSSDSSVRNAVPVEIERITRHCPIARVFCNGALAGKLYELYLRDAVGLEATVLPSTSPANAVWSLKRLTEKWREVGIL